MSYKSICPLCGSRKARIKHEALIKDLVKLYKRLVGSVIKKELAQEGKLTLYVCDNCDLMYFSPLIAGSESFYEALQKNDWYYLEEKFEYDVARTYIKENDFVLEIGCGKGAFAKFISSPHFTGLEFSENAIQMSRNLGIDVRREPIEQHAQENSEKYDIVCAFQVLEHVPNVSEFLSHAVNCIKPGGLLIISVPSADSFVSIATNNVLNLPPHHVTWWSDKALQYIASHFSLDVISLIHEPLQAIHKAWYASVITRRSLVHMFKYNHNPLIDISLGFRMISLLAKALAFFVYRGFDDEKVLPKGHSVIFVCRKPA